MDEIFAKSSSAREYWI